LCPFHDDKSPSLQFSKEKNICTCFSSKCNAGTMDIIGLTEKKLNLNTHEAIMQLKEWKCAISHGNGSVKNQSK
jgi:DNA primase